MSTDQRVRNMRGIRRTEPRVEDSPEQFYELSEERQRELLAFIDKQPVKSLCGWFVTSLSLLQRFGVEHDWTPSNGELKGSMAVSGFVAHDPEAVVWTFQIDEAQRS